MRLTSARTRQPEGCVKAFTQLAGTHGADHQAGHVGAREPLTLGDGSQPSLLERRLQSERPVRSMSVVVLGVDPKDLLKVDAPENEKPVQALGPQPDGVDGEEIAGDDPGGRLSSSSEVLHVT
jgi:hypothetical protein